MAAKLENKSGPALLYIVTLLSNTASFRLPNISTVFQAEVMAVKNSINWLLEPSSPRFQHYKIHIDSQATLRALNKRHITSKLVLETVNSLNELAALGTVSLVWIRAHKGNTGNELADDLAKVGAGLPQVTSTACIPRKAVRDLS